ncbi:hypothetical protein HYS91_04550 [Candidatus Daviesbacteria bacterium]|nr:hypothetical protein [Candidatus Daviesbacteria bacterium]
MTLTEAAKITKKVLLFSSIFIVVSLTIWLSYRFYYYNIYLPNLPPVEILPDYKFGPLSPPALPESSVSSSNFSYSLDTETGNLPTNIPKLMKVYLSTPLSVNLRSSSAAKELAENLGFPLGPEVINPTLHKFNDELGSEITINLENGNFSFFRNLANTLDIPRLETLATREKIIENFKGFLNEKGLLNESLRTGRGEVIYGGQNIADSESAIVTVWPKDLDQYVIVTPQFSTGLIKASVSKYSEEKYIYLNFDFTFWPIDENEGGFGTYPVKAVTEAFEELKGGEGVVVIDPQTPNVSLRKIYLAYLVSFEYLPYIQPIYVFEGENYVGYVGAIRKDSLAR